MAEPSVILTVKLPADLYQTLRKTAGERGMTRYVIAALQKELAGKG